MCVHLLFLEDMKNVLWNFGSFPSYCDVTRQNVTDAMTRNFMTCCPQKTPGNNTVYSHRNRSLLESAKLPKSGVSVPFVNDANLIPECLYPCASCKFECHSGVGVGVKRSRGHAVTAKR